MVRRATLLSVIVAVVMVAGLLYLSRLRKGFVSDVSRQADQTAHTRLSEAALQAASGPTQIVTLYFPSYAEGKLLPENRSMSLAQNTTDRIRQILLALIEGSHQGHGSTLPPSTTIRAVFLLGDGTAFLDLSQEALTDFTPGIESECLTMYSIVDSLAANIPAVKRVKLLVQGQEVQTLDGHIDLTGYFVPDPSRIVPSQ